MKTAKMQKRISRILARTDWKTYWEDVLRNTEPEINAYDEARRKSLAKAAEKVLR